MFLLVSIRHVDAHPGGHHHGVLIQISINLGKTFLRISRIRNILVTWILARVFAYLPPFISQIPDFIYWTVLIFILIFFEWRGTENQQFTINILVRRKEKICDFKMGFKKSFLLALVMMTWFLRGQVRKWLWKMTFIGVK